MARSTIVAVAVALGAVGCGSAVQRAPVMPEGGPVTIALFVDPGVAPAMTEEQVSQRGQLSEYMRPHLIEVLGEAGYATELLASQTDYRPGPGRYLLLVRITAYDPGSAAARVLVGMGAGACAIDTDYFLYGMGQNPLYSGRQSRGSGRSWEALVERVDLDTVNDVTAAFGSLPPEPAPNASAGAATP